MTAGEASCKDGGVIIIAASCKEGHGGQALYEAFKNMESPQKILDAIHGVPRNETKPYQWKIHMTPASTLDEALCIARGMMGEDASITIIPNGSTVIVE